MPPWSHQDIVREITITNTEFNDRWLVYLPQDNVPDPCSSMMPTNSLAIHHKHTTPYDKKKFCPVQSRIPHACSRLSLLTVPAVGAFPMFILIRPCLIRLSEQRVPQSSESSMHVSHVRRDGDCHQTGQS